MEYRRYLDRNGETVVITWARWERHVCRFHGEMEGHEQVVRRVLVGPDRVNADATFADRECLYAFGVHPDFPDLYVKVVVQYHPLFDDARRGELITAYTLDEIPPEEHALWINP